MELKHCPFCGSDAKLMKESNTHCNCSNKDCLLYGDRYFHIDKWNTRQEAKEPQWPKKVYTYKSLPSRKDYRTGFNAARDLCKQAWKDEKERTPGIPGKQDKYV